MVNGGDFFLIEPLCFSYFSIYLSVIISILSLTRRSLVISLSILMRRYIYIAGFFFFFFFFFFVLNEREGMDGMTNK